MKGDESLKWVITSVSVLMAVVMSLVSVVLLVDNEHKENQVQKYKTLTVVNREQAIQTQLKYEAVQRELDETTENFEAAKKALSEYAAKEREQARASRSRKMQSKSRVSRRNADVGRSTAGLRDVTKYCPTGNTTASGKQPRVGMVATLSRSIPFGTRVLIEGIGEFVVEDRIGHGSEFDIFTSSCREAESFGRQHRRVTILDTD